MINLKSMYTVLLAAYILTSLLIPLASINKLIFVSLVAIYGIYLLFVKKKDIFACLKITLAPILIIGIFAYGFVRGMIGDADMALAIQAVMITGVFVLIYPIEEFQIDFYALMKIVAKIYILFFLIYVIYAINSKEYDLPGWVNGFAHFLDNGLVRGIGSTLKELGSGLIKYRSFFGGKGMQVYLGSTPFLMVLTDLLFIDFLRNRKANNLFLVFLALVLSLTTGSRTLMLLLPASLCVLIWLQLEKKRQIAAAIVIAIAGVAAFFVLLEFSNFFSLEERSNSVKVGHMLYYFKQLDLKQALLGDGLASFYYTSYSPAEMRFLAQTEITLLDHCRYFGIPLGISAWIMMIVPKIQAGWKDCKNWKVWKVKEELAVLLLYMIFAQTNPVLFNSFGLVVVLWYWDALLGKTKGNL